MKKLIIIFAVTLVGCSTEPETCWQCTFGTVQGVQKPDSVFCSDSFDPAHIFVNDEGQQIPSICEQR